MDRHNMVIELMGRVEATAIMDPLTNTLVEWAHLQAVVLVDLVITSHLERIHLKTLWARTTTTCSICRSLRHRASPACP